jgi:hypothetical protein
MPKKEIKKNKKSKGGRNRKLIELTTFVSTKPHECSDFINGSICSDKNILKAIVLAFNNENTNIENIMNFIIDPAAVKNSLEKAKKRLNCDSESCVVSHRDFKKFAIKNHIISNDKLEENLETRFKIEGPRNSTEWLSNYDIDQTLQDWAFKFEDFFPCPFAMIDFDKTGDYLHKYNMDSIYLGEYSKKTIMGKVKIPCRTFGCAVNTDVDAGNGKHWMALFVDMRDKKLWTIEFFNSTGEPPQKSIVNWTKKTKEILEQYIQKNNLNIIVEIIIVSSLEHQESNTECGLYTLFYIRARLENVPYSRFLEQEIPDENMIEFRKHCFRAKNSQ